VRILDCPVKPGNDGFKVYSCRRTARRYKLAYETDARKMGKKVAESFCPSFPRIVIGNPGVPTPALQKTGWQAPLPRGDFKGSTTSCRSPLLVASTSPLSGIMNSTIAAENLYYYHTDHLGTPIMMTDQNQSVVWEGEFLPFGEPFSITGTVTNNLRFPGQYYDEETGLHQNWHRDYMPEVGRYIEKDPIGLKGGINLYVYVGDDPINSIDMGGLMGCNPKYRPCCPINELAQIQKRIAQVMNRLARSYYGNSMGSVYDYGFTNCWPWPIGAQPNVSTSLSPCIYNCVWAHENVHVGQCDRLGWWKYNHTNASTLEPPAYAAELSCLQKYLSEATR
ncbi:MAG: RHS domain-containing protein, partial [Nitrospirae bacterium]|nr:RHS domain-containing protein [Nitrospirota bacterium]